VSESTPETRLLQVLPQFKVQNLISELHLQIDSSDARRKKLPSLFMSSCPAKYTMTTRRATTNIRMYNEFKLIREFKKPMNEWPLTFFFVVLLALYPLRNQLIWDA
jgi:hypothetical protein